MNDGLKVPIGEIARDAKVSVDTIKRWTDQGLIECERRANGRRMYDPITGRQQVQAIITGRK